MGGTLLSRLSQRWRRLLARSKYFGQYQHAEVQCLHALHGPELEGLHDLPFVAPALSALRM